jgi:hypothetical protein
MGTWTWFNLKEKDEFLEPVYRPTDSYECFAKRAQQKTSRPNYNNHAQSKTDNGGLGAEDYLSKTRQPELAGIC